MGLFQKKLNLEDVDERFEFIQNPVKFFKKYLSPEEFPNFKSIIIVYDLLLASVLLEAIQLANKSLLKVFLKRNEKSGVTVEASRLRKDIVDAYGADLSNMRRGIGNANVVKRLQKLIEYLFTTDLKNPVHKSIYNKLAPRLVLLDAETFNNSAQFTVNQISLATQEPANSGPLAYQKQAGALENKSQGGVPPPPPGPAAPQNKPDETPTRKPSDIKKQAEADKAATTTARDIPVSTQAQNPVNSSTYSSSTPAKSTTASTASTPQAAQTSTPQAATKKKGPPPQIPVQKKSKPLPPIPTQPLLTNTPVDKDATIKASNFKVDKDATIKASNFKVDKDATIKAFNFKVDKDATIKAFNFKVDKDATIKASNFKVDKDATKSFLDDDDLPISRTDFEIEELLNIERKKLRDKITEKRLAKDSAIEDKYAHLTPIEAAVKEENDRNPVQKGKVRIYSPFFNPSTQDVPTYWDIPEEEYIENQKYNKEMDGFRHAIRNGKDLIEGLDTISYVLDNQEQLDSKTPEFDEAKFNNDIQNIAKNVKVVNLKTQEPLQPASIGDTALFRLCIDQFMEKQSKEKINLFFNCEKEGKNEDICIKEIFNEEERKQYTDCITKRDPKTGVVEVQGALNLSRKI